MKQIRPFMCSICGECEGTVDAFDDDVPVKVCAACFEIETVSDAPGTDREGVCAMKVYTCTNFKGFYPVGTAAVVVADGHERAVELLAAALIKAGLADQPYALNLDVINDTAEGAYILRNGDYWK